MGLKQALQIDPPYELKFKGPFNVLSTSFLKLINPTDHAILFKIKTTAPKKYCVRPNSGKIDPKQVLSVQVCLQPYEYDPNERNKHKFMVQAMFAPSNVDLARFSVDQAWREANPDRLMDTKLKCVFECPVEDDGEDVGTKVSSPSSPVKSEDTTRPIGDTSNNSDGELVKAKKEVKQLLEEELTLRQENIALKEQVLLLQRQVHDSKSMNPGRVSKQLQSQGGLQAPVILVAVVMVLLGIVLGKFLL